MNSSFDNDDVVSHETAPFTTRILQPARILSAEEQQALFATFGHVHFAWDENGFPYISVLTESGTFADSELTLEVWLQRLGSVTPQADSI